VASRITRVALAHPLSHNHPPTHTHTFSQQQLAFTLPKTTAQTAEVKLLFETGKAAPQAT